MPDGPSDDPSTLVARVLGFGHTLFSAAPLLSSSGFFTLVWSTDVNSYLGAGVQAAYSTTRQRAPAAKPPTRPPPPAPHRSGGTATATTLAQLAAAMADPTVSVITLTAHLALPAQLSLTSRSLSIVGACSVPYTASGQTVPAGLCALDASGSGSRHFLVSGGASLRLSSLFLLGGSALQGGSALAVGRSSLGLSGCVVADSSAVGDGAAALAVGDSTLIVQNSSFTNCSSSAGSGGALAAVFSSSLSVSGSSFQACSSQVGGAVGVAVSSVGTVVGSALQGCQSEGYGGGAAVMSDSVLALSGCTLADCSASADGGGVVAWHSNLTMTATNVTRCITFQGCGGAVAVEFTRSVLVTNSVLMGNKAIVFGGGGVCVWHAAVTMSSSLLEGNSAFNGGGIVLEGGSPDDWCNGASWCRFGELNVSTTIFLNNSAIGSTGGAVDGIVGAVLSASACTFTANQSPSASGGAISFAGGSYTAIQVGNSQLIDNSAAACGGLSVLSASQVNVTGSLLQGNRAAGGYGGAMCFAPPPLLTSQHACVSGVILQLTDSSGDIAPVSPGSLLPPVPMTCAWELQPPAGCTTELRFAEIAQTSAGSYIIAVIDADSGQPLFISANGSSALPSVLTSAGDAGLLLQFNVTNQISQVTFATGFRASFRTLCPAPVVGAPAQYSDFTAIGLTNNSVQSNIAGGSGGGLYATIVQGFVPTRRVSLTIADGFFSENSCGGDGGALAVVLGISTAVSDTVLTGNSAVGNGGGMSFLNAAPVQLSDVTILYNSAGIGGGGAAFVGTNSTTKKSLFQANSAQAGYGGGALLSTGGAAVLSAFFSGCQFGSNVCAAAAGGGVAAKVESTAASTVALSLSSCRLWDNFAGDLGGSLAFEGPGSLQAANSVFESNTASSGGGAIAAAWCFHCSSDPTSATVGPRLAMTGCVANNNSVGALHGAVAAASLQAVTAALQQQSAAAAGSRGSCGTSFEGGGAIYLGAGSSANFSSGYLSNCTSEGDGGAVALAPASALYIADSMLDGNTAAGGGGAFALRGTAALTVSSSTVADSRAFYGGVLALSALAQSLSTITLQSLTLNNNLATAGSWAALTDSTAPFTQPSCSACIPPVQSSAAGPAGSGNLLATPPAVLLVTVPAATQTGSMLPVALSLVDGFGAPILSFAGLTATVTCAWMQPPPAPGKPQPPAQACSGDSVSGGSSLVVSSASMAFGSLRLFGQPGTTFGLSVAAVGPGLSLLASRGMAPFNVSVAPCTRALAQYSPLSRLCTCGPNSITNLATGSCDCQTGFVFVQGPSSAACVGTVSKPAVASNAVAASLAASLSSAGFTLLVGLLLRRARRRLSLSVKSLIIPPHQLVSPELRSARSSMSASGASGPHRVERQHEPMARANTAPRMMTHWRQLAGSPREGEPQSTQSLSPTDSAIPGAATRQRNNSLPSRLLSPRPLPAALNIGSPRVSHHATAVSWGDPASPGASTNPTSRLPVRQQSVSSGVVLAAAVSFSASSTHRVSQQAVQESLLSAPHVEWRGTRVHLRVASALLQRPAESAGFVPRVSVPPRPARLSVLDAQRDDASVSNASVNVIAGSGRSNEARGARRESITGRVSQIGRRMSSVLRRPPEVRWSATNLGWMAATRHPLIVTTFGASTLDGKPVLVEEFMVSCLSAMLELRSLAVEFSVVGDIAKGVVAGVRFLHESTPPVAANLGIESVMLDARMTPKIRIELAVAPSPRSSAAERPPPAAGGEPDARRGLGAWLRLLCPPPSLASGGGGTADHPWRGVPRRGVCSAPEILEGGPPSVEADVYAVGIILFALFAWEEPFAAAIDERGLEPVLMDVQQHDLRPVFATDAVPKGLRDAAIDCWARSASRRPRLQEVALTLAEAVAAASATRFSVTTARSPRTPVSRTSTGLASERVARARERAILDDVLPRHVVEALKAGRKVRQGAQRCAALRCGQADARQACPSHVQVEPETFKEVTIFFRSVRPRPAVPSPRVPCL